MPRYRNILVSAVCHTLGVATALRSLFPTVKVVVTKPLEKKKEDANEVRRLMSVVDAWVDVPCGEGYYGREDALGINPKLTYVQVPQPDFDVFQPDLCAVGGDASASMEKRTSRIGAWAYSQGIPPARAAKYFNAATFENLGYLSRWDQAVARLRRNFEVSDLKDDFDWFYRRIKRGGSFMYTPTHPKPFVIAELAKLIAVKLGRDRSILDIEVPAHDTHAKFIWPVYPEIARALSLPTQGYVWKLDNDTAIEGLTAYLEHSYSKYQKRGIRPDTITSPGIRIADLGEAAVPFG